MTGPIRNHRTQPLSSSAMLWGHLLHNTHQNHSRQVSSSRTGSSPTKTTLVHNVKAPVIPTDKTGTSARILLHDTKAHIERFTDSVHGLVKGVDIAKNKMESLSQLFERSHEHVIEEAATLVNRCQAELKKSIGNPVQKDVLDVLAKDIAYISHRLDSLSKDVKILHMANQNQNQTMTSLQEQQNKLLSCIVPLLPLVQAIPLHIESSRNHLVDHLEATIEAFPTLVRKHIDESLHELTSELTKLRREEIHAQLDPNTRHSPEYMRSRTTLAPVPATVDPGPSSSLALISSPAPVSRGSSPQRPRKRARVDSIFSDHARVTSLPSSSTSSLSTNIPSTPELSQEIPLPLEAQYPKLHHSSGPSRMANCDPHRRSSQPEMIDYPPPNQLALLSHPISNAFSDVNVTPAQPSITRIATPSLQSMSEQPVTELVEVEQAPRETNDLNTPLPRDTSTVNPSAHQERNLVSNLRDKSVTRLSPFDTNPPVPYLSSPSKAFKPMSIKQRRAHEISSSETRLEKRFLPVTDDEDDEDGDWGGFGF